MAIVCTMAGVASGLALATTLMAMQVADSMSTRCPYRQSFGMPQADVPSDHGYLGIAYVFHDGFADVSKVLPGTPAEAIDMRPHDHVLSINNMRIHSLSDLKARIFYSHPGETPSLVVERHGEVLTLQPTLVAWPSVTY